MLIRIHQKDYHMRLLLIKNLIQIFIFPLFLAALIKAGNWDMGNAKWIF